MIKKCISTAIILSAFGVSSVFAQEQGKDVIKTPVSIFNKENLKLIQNNELTNDFLKIITYSQNSDSAEITQIDYAKKYSDANEKFMQGNITSAYKEYKEVILASANEDFVNIGFAYKFANMGLFSLAQEAINNIKDREIYNAQIQLIKSRLFPQVVLSYDDEIYLAQNYTEIYYNNLAFEVTRDMSKLNDKYKRSDYAHYILSQAYYNTKEYSKAINEINKALSINPDNANYIKYKAQICCETNRLAEAVKLLDGLLSSDVNILDYQTDLEALRYYTLAKATKDRQKSRFYLANYFLKTADEQRAIKELNQNITANKKDYKSMALLAKTYFQQNKLADSMNLYEKAYKIKKSDPEILVGIADMYSFKKDYKNALDFYLKASKKDKDSVSALIKASLCYKELGMTDKSVEIANKVFEKENLSSEIYYIASQINKIKDIQYLKKAIAVNPMYVDAWLGLADIALKNNRMDLVEDYIKPVKYIDVNNYKYYYYSGLLNKKCGNKDAAMKDFKKALEINPFFEEASNEMKTEL